jgi:hypothetical protein
MKKIKSAESWVKLVIQSVMDVSESSESKPLKSNLFIKFEFWNLVKMHLKSQSVVKFDGGLFFPLIFFIAFYFCSLAAKNIS